MQTLQSQARRGSSHISRTLSSPHPDVIMTLRAARVVHSLHCSLQIAVALHGLPPGREGERDEAELHLQRADCHLRHVLLEYSFLSVPELRSATAAAYDHCLAVLALLEGESAATENEPAWGPNHAEN